MVKKIGIPENIISNEHMSINYINMIHQALIKENEN